MSTEVAEAQRAPTAPLNLRQKMAAVMAELGYIKKRGYNSFNKYDYVMAADVAAESAKVMAKYGIAFKATEKEITFPETRTSGKGGTVYVCRATMLFTFLDTESDETIEVVSTGEGTDNLDKSIYKAKTGALKYALVQTFLIATGDDPEEDDGKERGNGRRPVATPDAADVQPMPPTEDYSQEDPFDLLTFKASTDTPVVKVNEAQVKEIDQLFAKLATFPKGKELKDNALRRWGLKDVSEIPIADFEKRRQWLLDTMELHERTSGEKTDA